MEEEIILNNNIVQDRNATNELKAIKNISNIDKFILENKIIQVHRSKGISMNQKYPTYKDNKLNTLFYGICSKNDVDLCESHKGKKWVYWDFNLSNQIYENKKFNLRKINKLGKIINVCDNFKTYRILERQNIKFIYIGNEIINNQFISLNIFNSFLKNKKVIVVGPAPYLENYELGKYIDSFDVVIRINKGYQMTADPDKFGSRTDILFHCVSQKFENGGELSNDIIKQNNIKCVYFCYPKINKYEDTSFKFGGNLELYEQILDKNLNVNKVIISKYEYLDLENKIDTRPNSGLIAIDQICKQTEDVHVLGFTFFKGGYSKLYRSSIDGKTNNLEGVVLNRIKNTHDVDKQIKYFNKNILNKIIIDSYFKNLFKDKLTNYRKDYYCLDKNELVNN